MNSDSEQNALDTSPINSRRDFIAFLQQLRADYIENGNDWESQNLGDFLAALAAYAADISAYFSNMSIAVDADSASWRVFADMLRGATTYE